MLEEKRKMDARMAELEKVKKEIGREYEDMRYKYMKLGNQNNKLKSEISKLQGGDTSASRIDPESPFLRLKIDEHNDVEEQKKDLKDKMGNLQEKNKTLQDEILALQLREQTANNKLMETRTEKEELEAKFRMFLDEIDDEYTTGNNNLRPPTERSIDDKLST